MNTPISRRRFLGQASCAGVSSISLFNTLLNLRLAQDVAAVTAPASGEYRALVCLFLGGGCDTFNVLIPRDPTGYASYQTARSNLALPTSQIIDVAPIGTTAFGIHGGMPEVANLFKNGNAAFVSNVGTLIEPVQNVAQVNANSKRLPVGLYSHSDQIEQWQTSVPNTRSGIGWGGRMVDLLKGLNSNQLVPMQISLTGSNVWQTGNTVSEYAITPSGAVALSGYNAGWVQGADIQNAMSAAVDSQLTQQYANLLSQTYLTKKKQALDAYNSFASATSAALPGNISFPTTQVGNSLKMIAQTIQGRAALGATRQTFFVLYGGWDHHDDVITNQAAMLPVISQAIGTFYSALTAMGIANQVTLFTASDFGRTLTSNSRGSDHAWGSNQLVVGGAVKGNRIYGQFPSLALNPASGTPVNPLDTGRGRFIPTTSCDQYFAELALWLGVNPSDLPLVLPNIGNFYSPSSGQPPVGFMT